LAQCLAGEEHVRPRRNI